MTFTQTENSHTRPSSGPPVRVGAGLLSIEDVLAVAAGAGVALDRDAAYVERIVRGAAFLERLLAEDGVVYGVTTGYGDSCVVRVPPHLVPELPIHLARYHGCGAGTLLEPAAVRAVLATRLNSLARGYSGVRWQLLEQIESLINHGILPLIPSEGSVGASGDLTPLSYLASVIAGECEVFHEGRRQPAGEAMARVGMAPLKLAPKEGLAVMNGTAVMTALACLAWSRAEYMSRLAARITALASLSLRGNRGHFDPRLFAIKPHAGQNEVAAWIHADLDRADGAREVIRLQDRYSIRCAPHVIGVLRDALPWMRRDIENELNSANDNPLIDGEEGIVLHGGHFYGGHIAFAMDALKCAVANVADLMDRQLALLVDSKFNHGLAQNLSGASGERAALNHGFKAVQISVSAWTAEALKLTMPASVFSRSTECHNQDKVSMGTISARDCLRVLELTEQVGGALVLATSQAVELRRRAGELPQESLARPVRRFLDEVGAIFEFLEEDRRLDEVLWVTTQKIRRRGWKLEWA